MANRTLYATCGLVLVGGLIAYETANKCTFSDNTDLSDLAEATTKVILAGTNTGSLTASAYHFEASNNSILNYFYNEPLHDIDLIFIKHDQEQNPIS